MGKVIWEGWQADVTGAATPTGPVVRRDGTKAISIQLPAPQLPKGKVTRRRRDAKSRDVEPAKSSDSSPKTDAPKREGEDR